MDTIVHLAAMNRAKDPQIIFDTNIELVKKLIESCQLENVTPHILFSSSTQEEKDNLYGKSKKVGRELLEDWANKNNGIVSGMVIPNVFGPFGRPNYNSVVATFCHKVTHGEEPTILVDSKIELVYINELVDDIYIIIQNKKEGRIKIEFRH